MRRRYGPGSRIASHSCAFGVQHVKRGFAPWYVPNYKRLPLGTSHKHTTEHTDPQRLSQRLNVRVSVPVCAPGRYLGAGDFRHFMCLMSWHMWGGLGAEAPSAPIEALVLVGVRGECARCV